MRRWSAIFAENCLRLLGISVLRDGNILRLGERSLEVAEACSGMRLLTGFIALGVIFAYLSARPLWERLILLCSTRPIAVFVNAVRVAVMGVAAHHGIEFLVEEGTPHASTSVVLFGVAAAILWCEYYLLSHLFVKPAGEAQAEPDGDGPDKGPAQQIG
jgi:exosortase